MSSPIGLSEDSLAALQHLRERKECLADVRVSFASCCARPLPVRPGRGVGEVGGGVAPGRFRPRRAHPVYQAVGVVGMAEVPSRVGRTARIWSTPMRRSEKAREAPAR